MTAHAAAILAEREKAKEMETNLRDQLNRSQHDLLRREIHENP